MITWLTSSPGLKHLEWLINNSKIFKNAKRNYIACINWMIVILQTFVGQICRSISWCTQSCLRAIPLATQLWRNEILNITARRKIVKPSSDLVARRIMSIFYSSSSCSFKFLLISYIILQKYNYKLFTALWCCYGIVSFVTWFFLPFIRYTADCGGIII